MGGGRKSGRNEAPASTESALLRGAEQLADGRMLGAEDLAELDPDLAAGLKQIEALALGFGALQPAPLAPQLARGSRFGSLEIQEILGQGGYGTVYRAHDPQLDREVALKVPDDQSRGAHELLREGQLMARIDHPNVLKVLGVVEHAGRIGFCCELLRGENLEQWSTRQGRAGPGELVDIGTALCAALAALHREGVVHGDLKPANVLRHAEGRWVLADFGSGQLAWLPYSSSGTPAYMAPERLAGQPASAASDLYSLAVLLFRIATGHCPADASDPAVLAARLAAGDRESLADARPDLPLGLVQVIERGLAITPAERPTSAGAFGLALADAIRMPAATAARRHRYRWSAMAAATLLAGLGVTGWFTSVSREPIPARGSLVSGLEWTDGGTGLLVAEQTIAPGQRLALQLTLTRPAHVYVINEDQAGARFQLFPLGESELRNPLPAGATRLPGTLAGQTLSWSVTSSGGQERFVVLVTERPVAELETGLVAQASMARGGALLADGAPAGTERGVGGLLVQPQPPGDGWLKDLLQRHPAVQVHRFALRNPVTEDR